MVAPPPWQEFPEFFLDPAEMLARTDFYSVPQAGEANDFAEFHRHWIARVVGPESQVVYERRRPKFQKAPKS